jgi:hypothetical protein
MTRDYKASVFLPTTEFPMRGDLPKLEPSILERWEKIGLYDLIRQDSAGQRTAGDKGMANLSPGAGGRFGHSRSVDADRQLFRGADV